MHPDATSRLAASGRSMLILDTESFGTEGKRKACPRHFVCGFELTDHVSTPRGWTSCRVSANHDGATAQIFYTLKYG